MTQPDYPLPVLPSYELYQLAHIATFLADGLARHLVDPATPPRCRWTSAPSTTTSSPRPGGGR